MCAKSTPKTEIQKCIKFTFKTEIQKCMCAKICTDQELIQSIKKKNKKSTFFPLYMIVLNQPSFTLNQFPQGLAHKNKVLLAFVFERVLNETGSSSER